MTAFDIDRAGIGGDRNIRPDRLDQAVANDHDAVGDLGTVDRMDCAARDGVDARSVGKYWKCKDYRE